MIVPGFRNGFTTFRGNCSSVYKYVPSFSRAKGIIIVCITKQQHHKPSHQYLHQFHFIMCMRVKWVRRKKSHNDMTPKHNNLILMFLLSLVSFWEAIVGIVFYWKEPATKRPLLTFTYSVIRMFCCPTYYYIVHRYNMHTVNEQHDDYQWYASWRTLLLLLLFVLSCRFLSCHSIAFFCLFKGVGVWCGVVGEMNTIFSSVRYQLLFFSFSHHIASHRILMDWYNEYLDVQEEGLVWWHPGDVKSPLTFPSLSLFYFSLFQAF